MEKTLEQRVEELEKRLAELEDKAISKTITVNLSSEKLIDKLNELSNQIQLLSKRVPMN
ncbi:hypothetical protein [Thermoanaerobacterium sp. DL9XJH110]|uniref:hypothetical protein n=1 Tax=Thermoanaerobacterium sp. DL9XJH110 TaxID=3386643 RepID=UPI003BB6B21F